MFQGETTVNPMNGKETCMKPETLEKRDAVQKLMVVKLQVNGLKCL